MEHQEPGTFSELVVIGAFCRCTIAEKRICQHIFFSSIFKQISPIAKLWLYDNIAEEEKLLSPFIELR